MKAWITALALALSLVAGVGAPGSLSVEALPGRSAEDGARGLPFLEPVPSQLQMEAALHPSRLEADRPNVLLVISDDLNTRIGPYLDSTLQVHTPNLDALARSGFTFSRAYAQFPVCGPSRASILSGLYPEKAGVTSNNFDTANHRTANPKLADHPSLPGLFREQGYYTARVSKVWHVGVPGGIERGESGSDDPDAWDFAVNIMAPETLTPGTLETLSRGTHYGSTFARMAVADGSEGTQADVLAANQAIAILQSRLGRVPDGATNRTRLKPDAPFFLAVGFVRPHVPLIAPARYFAKYPDGEVRLVEVKEGDLDDVPEAAQRTSNARRFQMSIDEQRKAVAAYHASISFMDEQLGRVLKALDDMDARRNTIVVFLSDHGFNLGEHTAWQKMSLWEESVRVPLILAVPGRTSGSSGSIVELIDLYPTLADLAGLTSPARLQGESLVSIMDGDDPASGEAYTITAGGASLRTSRWRYNRWGEEALGSNEELYDHSLDPGEVVNLATDPRYRTDLDRMRSAFGRARAAARDSQ